MGESVVCRCSLHSRRAALTLLLVLAGAGAAPGRWPACSRRLPGASLVLELRGGGNYLDDLLDKSESSSSEGSSSWRSEVAANTPNARTSTVTSPTTARLVTLRRASQVMRTSEYYVLGEASSEAEISLSH